VLLITTRSCCCNSRSYCKQYDRQKHLLRVFYFNAIHCIVIAASRPVNKNVSTGAVIRAKRGTELGVHKLLANVQTGCYKLMPVSGWNGRIIGSQPFAYEHTH